MSFCSFRNGPRSQLHKYLSMHYGQSPTASTKLHQARSHLLRSHCSYHPDERVTNFCKSFNCLLPMCPRCVKEHSEQHARLGISDFKIGTHGDFEILENCLEQADNFLVEGIQRSEVIVQKAYEANESCRRQSEKLKAQFAVHKEKILSVVAQAFEAYEMKLEAMINTIEDCFAKNLQRITESLTHLVSSSKRTLESLYGSNSIDNLVLFYSTVQIRNQDIARNCQDALLHTVANKVVILDYPQNIDTIACAVNNYLHMELIDPTAPISEKPAYRKEPTSDTWHSLASPISSTQSRQNCQFESHEKPPKAVEGLAFRSSASSPFHYR